MFVTLSQMVSNNYHNYLYQSLNIIFSYVMLCIIATRLIKFCHFWMTKLSSKRLAAHHCTDIAGGEASDGRPFPQHARPVGDRQEQPQVHEEARTWPVRGGLGGRVEQHNASRN